MVMRRVVPRSVVRPLRTSIVALPPRRWISATSGEVVQLDTAVYNALLERLFTMPSASSTTGSVRSVSYADFRKMCKAMEVSVESAHIALNQMQTSGRVVRFQVGRNDVIILDPPSAAATLREALQSSNVIRTRSTQARLDALRKRYEELCKLRRPLVRKSFQRAHAYRLGCLLFFLMQFSLLFMMVFVWFDWNLCEPITFFITFTTVVLGFLMFGFLRLEASHRDLMTASRVLAYRRLIRSTNFPVQEWTDLRREIPLLEEYLRRNPTAAK
eukprot:TRINITY_DN50_c0_g1_i1.p1 TRINITY_DN50_c0_g1~~TRINITY_DN50_c0_g1_i1.p1  ORF type:complete len:272 (+),score=7.96 TRINITY_DN50_c0_g1_i1:76-891(+)